MKPRPNLHIQILDTPNANLVIPVIDINREDISKPQYLSLNAIQQPVGGGTAPVYATTSNQTLTGAGAVNAVSPVTFYESTGASQALTLADAGTLGVVKTVIHSVDGGDGVLTPDNFVDGTTITFTNAGDKWSGVWTSAGWLTTDLSGAVIA